MDGSERNSQVSAARRFKTVVMDGGATHLLAESGVQITVDLEGIWTTIIKGSNMLLLDSNEWADFMELVMAASHLIKRENYYIEEN